MFVVEDVGVGMIVLLLSLKTCFFLLSLLVFVHGTVSFVWPCIRRFFIDSLIARSFFMSTPLFVGCHH